MTQFRRCCRFYKPPKISSLRIEMCVISYCKSQTCLPESVNTSSIISSELNPSSRLTVCRRKELFKFPLLRLSQTSRIPLPHLFTLP